jgi:hypothetical protein
MNSEKTIIYADSLEEHEGRVTLFFNEKDEFIKTEYLKSSMSTHQTFKLKLQ